MTTIRSGFSLLRPARDSGAFREAGWNTVMPASRAMFLMGGAVRIWCLPTGTVGLRDQPYQIRVPDQAAEGGNGNVARAHEDDAHGREIALPACAGQC